MSHEPPDSSNPYAAPQLPEAAPLPPPQQWTEATASQRSPRQWRAAIRQRIRKGESARQVQADATAAGLRADVAETYAAEELSACRRGAATMMAVGFVIALLGMIVTVVSFVAALQQPNGDFLIWFGPVILGGAIMLVGFVRLARTTT